MTSRFWTEEKRQILKDNIHLSDTELATLTGSTESGVNQARLRYRILRPKKVFREKICPICKSKKSVEDFGKYKCHSRNTLRVQNYCKECEKPKKNLLSKKYYEKKGAKVRKYQQKYRKDNKEMIRPKKRKFNAKYRKELHTLYVIDRIRQSTGLTANEIRQAPELIEAERLRIKLNRTIKTKKDEK